MSSPTWSGKCLARKHGLDYEGQVCDLCPTVPDRNHLPPELAAQILERDAQIREQPLTEAIREILTLLVEECCEVGQRVTKILRFGLTVNPWTGKHNRDTLEAELGDHLAAVAILRHFGVVSDARILAYARAKLEALRVPDGRLRHARFPAGLLGMP